MNKRLARETEREIERLKKQVVELIALLLEVRDNPNNNVFEKFEMIELTKE